MTGVREGEMLLARFTAVPKTFNLEKNKLNNFVLRPDFYIDFFISHGNTFIVRPD